MVSTQTHVAKIDLPEGSQKSKDTEKFQRVCALINQSNFRVNFGPKLSFSNIVVNKRPAYFVFYALLMWLPALTGL